MMKKKQKKVTKKELNFLKKFTRTSYIVYAVVAAVLLVVGGFTTMAGFNPGHDYKMRYTDTGRIDYKVYLKENSFFKDPYLSSRTKTFITNLIDYLDLDFNYGLDFDDPVNIDYNYHFVASKQENTRNLSISENLKINYDEYNKFLSDFKTSTRVAATGNLKISLVFDGSIYSDAIGEPTTLEYEEVYFNIPLAESSVEATVTGNSSEPREHFITRHIDQNIVYSAILRTVGILMIIAGVLVAAVAVRDYRDKQSDKRFENTVKHLLNTYDSVIVEVDKQPKLTGMNVLTVNDFDELLDVYNSIHMPVSYYRDNIGAHFIVISEHMAWRYSILERDFKKKK